MLPQLRWLQPVAHCLSQPLRYFSATCIFFDTISSRVRRIIEREMPRARTNHQIGSQSSHISVMGREYDSARMALANIDNKREIPVISKSNTAYSGFHQGSGETTVAELLRVDLPKYSLVLIDEIESSLHPRSQRRLVRDLAERCRELVQIILTTHSPYVIEELPLEARKYILETKTSKEIVSGVSPQFANASPTWANIRRRAKRRTRVQAAPSRAASLPSSRKGQRGDYIPFAP
jgi:hypothetical protein